MARITVEDCIDKFPSRFELVLVASQRARKLHSGDNPTVEKDNDKNTVIALREIADSTLTVDQMKENLIQEYQTITISDEEDENMELEVTHDDINKDIEAVEKVNSDENKDIIENKDNVFNSKNEVENEMNSLISQEDKEIQEQYEITDSLDNNNEINSDNNPDTVEKTD